ncbi:MAG TPA: FAD-dependent oxidoreductase [Candidatus Limnocylindrales bacterium]|nr:FAD-dependent oxidoreductase [Candidatus Limnocylindrales bacterium]
MPEVVVVGAGIVGLSTAWNLVQQGVRDIVIVERRHIGAGASGKSGAIIRTYYANEHETRLAVEGLQFFRSFGERVGVDCRFQEHGYLVFAEPDARADLEANLAIQRTFGIDARVIDADELREIDSSASIDDGAVVGYEPTAGAVDGMEACNAFATVLLREGVEIRLGTTVTAVRHEAGRVTGVETTAGDIATDRVIIAPGGWAHGLLRPLGFDLPMIPATSRIAIFRWPHDRDRRHPVAIDHRYALWLRPIFGEHTLLGAERGVRREVEDPEHLDETIDQQYVEHCREQLARRYPVMRHAVGRGGWTGLVMRSADSRPIIGPFDGYEGLLGLVGDSGTCFKTAPAIGRALAQLITTGTSDVDLSPFHHSRFDGGGRWVDRTDTAPSGSISR